MAESWLQNSTEDTFSDLFEAESGRVHQGSYHSVVAHSHRPRPLGTRGARASRVSPHLCDTDHEPAGLRTSNLFDGDREAVAQRIIVLYPTPAGPLYLATDPSPAISSLSDPKRWFGSPSGPASKKSKGLALSQVFDTQASSEEKSWTDLGIYRSTQIRQDPLFPGSMAASRTPIAPGQEVCHERNQNQLRIACAGSPRC